MHGHLNVKLFLSVILVSRYLVELCGCEKTHRRETVPIQCWLTNNTEHSSCSEADRFLASRANSQILLNPKITFL